MKKPVEEFRVEYLKKKIPDRNSREMLKGNPGRIIAVILQGFPEKKKHTRKEILEGTPKVVPEEKPAEIPEGISGEIPGSMLKKSLKESQNFSVKKP